LLGLENDPNFVHQPALPLELRLHQPEVNDINADSVVNAFDLRPELAAHF
jgi:hypothetical protein